MVLKDSVFKAVTRFHQLLFDVTKGKLTGEAIGMPMRKLTTVGLKTG